jgi:hypothetical protein
MGMPDALVRAKSQAQKHRPGSRRTAIKGRLPVYSTARLGGGQGLITSGYHCSCGGAQTKLLCDSARSLIAIQIDSITLVAESVYFTHSITYAEALCHLLCGQFLSRL